MMQTPYVGVEPVSFWWSALAVVAGLALMFGPAVMREWKRQAGEESARRWRGHQTTEGEP